MRRPRAIDPIGLTLRAAFGDDSRLPCDIARCLAALDRVPFRH